MKCSKECRPELGLKQNLESRLSPAVITYPLAPSIIIFDPKGDREPEPRPYGEEGKYLPIDMPDLDASIDTPKLDVSNIA